MPMIWALGGAAAIQAGGSIWSGLMSKSAAEKAAAAMDDASRRAETGLTERQNQALALLAPFLAPGQRSGDTLSLFSVSPQERARQSALERADLESEIARLSQYTPWDTFPLLTGRKASERREALYTEVENKRLNALRDAKSKLENFKKREAIQAQFDQAAKEPIDASPLYQFQLEQGTKYLDRSLARKGLRGSGEGVKLLGDFVRGLGAEESDRQFNRLMGLFNTGAGAASNSANLLTAFAPQIAQTQLSAGQSKAQGILGEGEATANMITGVTNAATGGVGNLLQYNLFKTLINRNANSGGTKRGFDPVYDSV